MSCQKESANLPETATNEINIKTISKTHYRVGDTLALTGENFGSERGSKKVAFKSKDTYIDAEDYLEWSDKTIKIIIPEGVDDGHVFISEYVSNWQTLKIDRPWILKIIDWLIQISLGITIIYLYLKINKIWKRKHDKEVAESQSLTGLFIYICNCILWVSYYAFVEPDSKSLIDTSIYIVEGSVLFLIGTGIFVKGQRKEGLWILIKKALKLERKEADYLLKKWIKPQNAEAILQILHQIAMIDEEFDPKEQELIHKFAKDWNIDYNFEKLENERKSSKENNYMRLRKSLENYLNREPPMEQAAQLKDLISTMIQADDKVTNEEMLISAELIPMVENYLNEDEGTQQYLVLIVPQHPEQENSIQELLPNSQKINTSGGVAFEIGSFYSKKYAEMVCEQYREINYFTIVNQPSSKET
jgi:hypothetical protein